MVNGLASVNYKDIANYWNNNGDLARDLRIYWDESEDSPMDKVFPIRFYGDGADTIGLNAFELMSMIAVAPQHSSSLKTRIVFLADILYLKFFSQTMILGKTKHAEKGSGVMFPEQGWHSETLCILPMMIAWNCWIYWFGPFSHWVSWMWWFVFLNPSVFPVIVVDKETGPKTKIPHHPSQDALHQTLCIFQGNGLWPTHDWDGKKFTKTHYPKWHSLAGTQLCGGWRGVLDGIQGDQDFLHKVFNFKRPLLQHVFSWVSTCQLCTGLAPPQHLNLKMVTVSPSFWGAVRMVRVFPQVVLWSYASRF